MKRIITLILLSILLLVGGFFLYRWIKHSILYVSTDDARVQGNLVALSSKVQGRITWLGADNGDVVRKGQVIVRLDDRDWKAVLSQSEAQLESTRSEETRQTEIVALQIKEASQRIAQAEDTLSSNRKLLAISQTDMTMNGEIARAQVYRQESAVAAAKAQLAQARASEAEAARDTERSVHLYDRGAISKQAEEQAATHMVVLHETTRAALENVEQQEHLQEVAQANLHTIQMKELQMKSAESNVDISHKGVNIAQIQEKRNEVEKELLKSLAAKRQEAEAKVRYNRLMLKETVIYSPVDGVVAQRNANSGEMALPGSPLFYIIDSNDIWVTANIEEGQIRRVVSGATVDVHVDAYPGRIFGGTVIFVGPVTSSELSLFPSDNPAGTFIKVTHRLPVRIRIEHDDMHLLKPGMNVIVNIKAQGEEHRSSKTASRVPRNGI